MICAQDKAGTQVCYSTSEFDNKICVIYLTLYASFHADVKKRKAGNESNQGIYDSISFLLFFSNV